MNDPRVELRRHAAALDQCRVTLKDSQWFTHYVLFDGEEIHGYQNIAHGFPPEQRSTVTHRVLAAVQLGQPMPYGFSLEEKS